MNGEVSFWDTVVTNLAPIIIALTGFGAMIGGFVMQNKAMRRQFDDQNRKLDQNANEAKNDRTTISAKVDEVKDATNGIVQTNAELSRALGVSEGTAAGRAAERADRDNAKS